MKILKNNKAWFTLLEVFFASMIFMIIITSVYYVSMYSYKEYNSYRIQNYVIQENQKLLNFLWRIRYATSIQYIDKNPTNHPNISDLKLNIPEGKTIQYVADDLWTDTNDISFIDVDSQKLYIYNKDIIELKKFEVTPLDPDIHRWWVRIHIIIWASWKKDPITWKINYNTAKLFWNTKYYLDYYITYTFRNSLPPEN